MPVFPRWFRMGDSSGLPNLGYPCNQVKPAKVPKFLYYKKYYGIGKPKILIIILKHSHVLLACMSVHMCVCCSWRTEEGIRSLELNYRQLWAATRVVGLKPRSSGRSTGVFDHWAISVAPTQRFLMKEKVLSLL